MLRYDRRLRRLAIAFAVLAGFVDAVGFLEAGGLFVSFMSGNSTRLAVGVAEGAPLALAAGGLILLFLLGVVAGALLAAGARRMHRKVAASALVAALLVLAAALHSLGWVRGAVAMLCLAMGAANTVFQRDGEVSIGVTYMTGTLVRLGHRIADALRGGDRLAWLPYLLLWLGLVAGGIGGALIHLWSAAASLWLAAAYALVLLLVVGRLVRSSGG